MLTIEDGTGIAGADSYATAAEFVSRAYDYGWTIPTQLDMQEVLLRRAAEAMNALQWKGTRAGSGQALAWPRRDVVVDGEYLPDDHIPGPIKYGQMALAAEIHADDVSPPESRRGAVVREKVDVLEVQYAEVKNDGRLMRAAPDRPSQVQFLDYLQKRGLFLRAVRA